jgi:hypothetical protein
MMQEKQYNRFVATPGEHLRRCMQCGAGTRLLQETHVLCFDEQVVRPCAVVDMREREPPRKTSKCLLDAHHVVARVEVTYVVAFPCIGTTSPDLDWCSGLTSG